MPAVIAVCVSVAVVGAALARGRVAELRCEDGHLVAYRARLLPFGSSRLDPDRYPPLRVTPSQCSNLVFDSVDALERRYVQLSDAASESTTTTPATAALTEWFRRSPGNVDEPIRSSTLERDLEEARTQVLRVRQRVEEARRLGRLEPDQLRRLELEYADLLGAPPSAAVPPERERASPPVDGPPPTSASRAL